MSGTSCNEAPASSISLPSHRPIQAGSAAALSSYRWKTTGKANGGRGLCVGGANAGAHFRMHPGLRAISLFFALTQRHLSPLLRLGPWSRSSSSCTASERPPSEAAALSRQILQHPLVTHFLVMPPIGFFSFRAPPTTLFIACRVFSFLKKRRQKKRRPDQVSRRVHSGSGRLVLSA